MARSTSSEDPDSVEESEQSVAPTGMAAPATHAAARFLRRAEVARLLGVSKSTLRRMEGTTLKPLVGPRNERLFLEEEVRAVVVTRRAGVAHQTDVGEIAAEAFTRFDAGGDVVDVVKALRVAPELVESLHDHWARLRQQLVLSAATRSAISTALVGWDDRKLTTEADLLALVKRWVTDESVRRCWQCKNEWACFCRDCAKRWGREAARSELAEKKARTL
jgi:predicted DNA-binding transcriptional regulator AlpA